MRMTNDFDDDSIADGWRTFWWEFVGMSGLWRFAGFALAFLVAWVLVDLLARALHALHAAA